MSDVEFEAGPPWHAHYLSETGKVLPVSDWVWVEGERCAFCPKDVEPHGNVWVMSVRRENECYK